MNKKEISELNDIYLYVSEVLKNLTVTYEPNTFCYLTFLLKQHLDAYVNFDETDKVIDIDFGRYVFSVELNDKKDLELSKCVEIYDESEGYIGFYDLENNEFNPVEN